jgi:hypothetical protein
MEGEMTNGILAVALQEDTGVGVPGAVAGLGFMLLWLASATS